MAFVIKDLPRISQVGEEGKGARAVGKFVGEGKKEERVESRYEQCQEKIRGKDANERAVWLKLKHGIDEENEGKEMGGSRYKK